LNAGAFDWSQFEHSFCSSLLNITDVSGFEQKFQLELFAQF
jgi:hypothetical protein